jgi:hypothetical protein
MAPLPLNDLGGGGGTAPGKNEGCKLALYPLELVDEVVGWIAPGGG